MRRLLPAIATVACLAGGCSRFDLGALERLVPGGNTVTVQLLNDTSFAVDPFIRFDDDSGPLAQLFPAEQLTTGLLQPGDLLEFSFDCDKLGLILSDGAQQLDLFGRVLAQADDSGVLKRADEYDCGDLVRFRFLGDFETFGVVASVNGAVVD